MERPTEHIGTQPQAPVVPSRREPRGLRETIIPAPEPKVPAVATEPELDLDFGQEPQAPQAPTAVPVAPEVPASREIPATQPAPAHTPETADKEESPIFTRRKATYGGVAALIVAGGMGGMFFKQQEGNGPQIPAAMQGDDGQKNGENEAGQEPEKQGGDRSTRGSSQAPIASIDAPQKSSFEASLTGEQNGADEASQLIQKAKTQKLTEREINQLRALREKDIEGLRTELEKAITAQREAMEAQILQQRNNLQATTQQRREELESRIQRLRAASDELINQSRTR